MTSSRSTSIVDIHLILERDGALLLGERRNTGYLDGHFHLPAGHLESTESALRALVRETEEEIGVHLEPDLCRLVFCLHQMSGGSRVGLFFRPKSWTGEPSNREPEKCGRLTWHRPDALPSPMVPYAAYVIGQMLDGQIYGEFNW